MWTKNANITGWTVPWQQALDYVAGMNAGTYPNYSYHDWRLPNLKELHSLTDFPQYAPALPAGHPFTNVQGDYWSSTTGARDPGYAWDDNMWNGCVHYYSKSVSFYFGYVWPVRGGSFGPTVINLSSFTATPKAGKVIIEWTTASEIDNAGFNLYRAEAENGEYMKINSSLIPAEGSPTEDASYQFVDEDVKNRKTYYYKLQDVDLKGISTFHRPVSATYRIMHR
jgi:hypothetical protein